MAKSVQKKNDNKKEEAYNIIKERIVCGELEAGTFAYETKLAEELKISRTPVREALKQLANENLLEFVPTRGMYIPYIRFDDVIEMYDIRIVNDGLAAYLCTNRINDRIIEAFKAILDEESVFIDNKDKKGILRMDRAFHRLYITESGNRRLEEFLLRLDVQMERIIRMNSDDNDLVLSSLKSNKMILDAMMARDAEQARLLTCEHWSCSKETYIRQYIAGTLSIRSATNGTEQSAELSL